MTETKVAIYSAIIAATVSLFMSLLTYKRNEKEFYSKFVSNERMLWIKETRKLVAEMLALCDSDHLSDEDKQRFNYLKNEIILRLNPDVSTSRAKYKEDQMILEVLKSNSYDLIKTNKEIVIECFMMIFKSEWDITKIEAGRSKRQYLRYQKTAELIRKEQ